MFQIIKFKTQMTAEMDFIRIIDLLQTFLIRKESTADIAQIPIELHGRLWVTNLQCTEYYFL